MNKVKIVLFILLILIAYISGCLFPISNITPIFKAANSEMTSFEIASIRIDAILAFFTFLTILTALFKEDIVKLWRKPKFSINPNSLLKEHTIENSNSTSIYADEYKVIITVENVGLIDAKNVILQLMNIEFINHQTTNSCKIDISNKYIEVNNNKILSKNSTMDFPIASLKKTQNPSELNGPEDVSDEYVYKVGDNKISKDYYNGEIMVTFLILCEGNYSIKKRLSMKWDNKWNDRLTDINPGHFSAALL